MTTFNVAHFILIFIDIPGNENLHDLYSVVSYRPVILMN